MKVNYLKVFVAVIFAGLVMSVSANANQTDEQIVSSANNSYVYKNYLKDDSVQVMSSDGVVTLKGTVSEESHRGLAEKTVESLPGVIKVDNQLLVSGQQPVENSDGWVSMKVKSALLFNRNVSGVKTQVFVTDGTVTLKGQADNQAQKDLTEEYAKDVNGVKGVINEMTIADGSNNNNQNTNDMNRDKDNKIDDASITAQVKMAFMMHHSTSAFKTGVSTNNGVVTLTGNAMNGAAKDMATKVANDINGVKNVVNNMTINS